MQQLGRLADEYFQTMLEFRPFAATAFGISGYDDQVSDPSREAEQAYHARFAKLAQQLTAIDQSELDAEDRVTYAALASRLQSEQDSLRSGLHEVAVSATMMGPVAMLFSTVPSAPITDQARADAYVSRLDKLGGFYDALAARYRKAAADGRVPTARGVRQTITQLDAYLAAPLEQDPLLRPHPGPQVDANTWRAQVAEMVQQRVRPALARYRAVLTDELLPLGRPDDQVGVCHIPGGVEGYLAQTRVHTTTALTPEQIHETGLELVAQLREEFALRGARALGTSDVAEVLARLRDDPSLRYESAAQIVAEVDDALRRAQEALPDWFRSYDIAPCVVQEMNPVEAEKSVLGYYRPPAVDGSRPGTHVVNTHRPDLRTRFEYEALAFHESVPGHHLQIGLAQTLTQLPDFRRFTYVTAHGEGWGLYTERLCDEMGLYSGELARLGMVSFDAWRACRLVVDTGMHHYGWSREQAIAYMRQHTALSDTNIVNEVDRYIAAPGQALAYMVGKLRIRQLREAARQQAGAAFDIKEFHHQVLGHGSLPLDTVEQIVLGG